MRTRLVALILIPTIAAVLLGGLRIASSVDRAADYGRAQQLAELGEKITALTHALAGERGAITSYIATGRGDNLDRVEKQQGAVDRAIAEVQARMGAIDDSYGSLVQSKVDTVRLRLERLPALRELAVQSKLPALATIDKYSNIIADLIALTEVIAEGSSDRQLAERVRMLVVLARATEQAVQQRDVMLTALLTENLSQRELDWLVGARAQQDSAIVTFKALASVEYRQLYEDTVTGVAIDDAERLALTVISQGVRADLGIDADEWFDVATVEINRLHDVESRLAHALVEQSSDLASSARWDVLVDSLIVVVVLALALVATSIVARSMVRPLQALRSGALDVAGHRLPDAVRRLRESPEARPTVEPVGVDSSDEIGEVARSFDEVHREAVRLAAEEAQLRGTVSAMFVNLSRRSQTLVERQLRLIDGLEQGERDPDRLSSLFRLDHLATRMRRNGENLLVLAGQEPARRWSQPVPLIDVVRASLSEVEQYERVRLRVQPGSVGGWVVNDLVHLVAELLDNATSFSPPDTTVTVTGQPLSDGYGMLEIEDSGIGMPPAELMQANERLAEPPVVDVSVSRRMGLFVVGRLASRHAIRVELRLSRGGGIVAQVLLPAGLLVQATGGQTASADAPLYPEPWPSAAEPLQVAQQSAPALETSPQHMTGASASTPPPQGAPEAGYGPYDPSSPDDRGAAVTDPSTSPVGARGDALPIFDAIQSEWFRHRKQGPPIHSSVSEPDVGAHRGSAAGEMRRTWRSPGDEGWRAAEAVNEPVAGETTAAGLPKRVPGANLVPGSVGATSPPETAAPAVRSAAAVRDRLSDFHRGVSEGKAAGGTANAGNEPDSPSRDEREDTWAR